MEGCDKAPFAVLLVTPEYEFLIRHPRPSQDFTLIGYDTVLKSNVYSRKRTFSANLLATFPAVSGIPTIVIGQAENTSKKTSTPWVITLLHEHFHQLQNLPTNILSGCECIELISWRPNGYVDAELRLPLYFTRSKAAIYCLEQTACGYLANHE